MGFVITGFIMLIISAILFKHDVNTMNAKVYETHDGGLGFFALFLGIVSFLVMTLPLTMPPSMYAS